ncbi:MAG: acetoacetate--CoA ligase [Actinomycetota bacterium]|nr:acetoacetate--CoA ligase [Actinomycetota bacterium]
MAGTPMPTKGADQAQIVRFAAEVADRHGVDLADYEALRAWSVEHLAEFWAAVWEWCDVVGNVPGGRLAPDRILVDDTMPGAVWFPDVTVNYVDQVIRHGTGDRAEEAAVIGTDEAGGRRQLTWSELLGQTGALAATLRAAGVGQGDRVVGYVPNIPEAVVAFLATASIGAVWAACGQDYAPAAAADRLGQLEPVVLIAANGYRYGGKVHDRGDAVAELRRRLPQVRTTVLIDSVGTGEVAETTPWSEAIAGDDALQTVPVAFDHPLWVLFSSGTTGTPKGIVHGHGGVVLEHLKSMALHWDLGPGGRFCWYTSPSWMMWNFNVAGLLVGATIVTHDGSPVHPDPGALWALAEAEHLDVLGMSAGYLLACEKAEITPSAEHDLSALNAVGSTGSTLAPSSQEWYLANVSADVALVSISGGTDMVTAFVGGAPNVEVHVGEIPCRCLGAAVESWDPSGEAVIGEVGELVITRPMPSMPVGFWNDPDGTRYRDAYFAFYPGVWRHGDWVTITERGSVIVHGRSDSTLNRHGVRMGSSDIYQVVEQLAEVTESLVVGVDQADGGYWMPLFVVLGSGIDLDDGLRTKIGDAIRQQASSRHVPDEIIEVAALPHTRTGKKLEVPIKRILAGAAVEDACQLAAVDDPDRVRFFADLAARRRS